MLLDAMAEGEFADWAPLYVRWEVGLLDELGFRPRSHPLRGHRRDRRSDLSSRRAAGGRSRTAAAEPYRERLFALPPFLLGSQNAVTAADIVAGLRLTAHFLAERVLVPHGKALPAARIRLEELAGHESE